MDQMNQEAYKGRSFLPLSKNTFSIRLLSESTQFLQDFSAPGRSSSPRKRLISFDMESSAEAIQRVEEFREEVPKMFHRFPAVYRKLIPFFIDRFETDLDPNALPRHFLHETERERALRNSVTNRLMEEFVDVCDDYQYREDKDDDVPATLLYWYLSKVHRQPSDQREGSKSPELGRVRRHVTFDRTFAASHLSQGPRGLPQLAPCAYPENHVIVDPSSSDEEYQTYSSESKAAANDNNQSVGKRSDDDDQAGGENSEDDENTPESNWNAGSEYQELASDRPLGNKIQLDSLGQLDRKLVLDHLLSKTKANYARYGPLLESNTIVDTLEDALDPTVKDMCEKGSFHLNG